MTFTNKSFCFNLINYLLDRNIGSCNPCFCRDQPVVRTSGPSRRTWILGRRVLSVFHSRQAGSWSTWPWSTSPLLLRRFEQGPVYWRSGSTLFRRIIILKSFVVKLTFYRYENRWLDWMSKLKMLFLLIILTTETNKLLNPVFVLLSLFVRFTRTVILELGGLLIFFFSFFIHFLFSILHFGRFKLPSYTFMFFQSYKEKLTVNN